MIAHRSGWPLKKTPNISHTSRSYQFAPLKTPTQEGIGLISSV